MRKTLSLLVAAAGLAFGAPVITVIPSIGPSGAAASAPDYDANALLALFQGLTSSSAFGTAPSAYTQVSGPVPANSVIETTFNSWLGVANPSSPFNFEFGNNLYFGLSIRGGTESFSLRNLVYADNFGDFEPTLAGTTPFSFDVENYDSRFLAYLDNGTTPGVLDAGDTQVALDTDGASAVNYLFYRGVGGFFLPVGSDGDDPQTRLNNTVAALNDGLPIALTGGYCLSATPGDLSCATSGLTSATANLSSAAFVDPIPEPSTYALMGLGLAALAYARRRLA